MCDTFVAMPKATGNNSVVFGKNSDRPHNENQNINYYAAANPSSEMLQCTYLEIPQVAHTYAINICQPDWMWGAEMGANEHGLVIGNEAVWTRVPVAAKGLLGMDLLRLALERAENSLQALEVIGSLILKYNQGGACAEGDASFTYHNSFLIADYKQAIILETAGKFWVAKEVQDFANISNELTIRTEFDWSSPDLQKLAKSEGYYNGKYEFDFAHIFSTSPVGSDPNSRLSWGKRFLEEDYGEIDTELMKKILTDHDSGICMHDYFQTTASMVSQLKKDEQSHWMSGRFPCKNSYELQEFK